MWSLMKYAEYESLMENDTSELVDLPEGQKPIELKWIFKVKRGSDGDIKRYKARLVARDLLKRMELIMKKPLHQWYVIP